MPAALRHPDLTSSGTDALSEKLQAAARTAKADGTSKSQEAFHQLLGETIFRMVLKQMRKSVGNGGLFRTGGAAGIIAGQMDEQLAELMGKSQPPEFSQRYFDQFSRLHGIEPKGPKHAPNATDGKSNAHEPTASQPTGTLVDRHV